LTSVLNVMLRVKAYRLDYPQWASLPPLNMTVVHVFLTGLCHPLYGVPCNKSQV